MASPITTSHVVSLSARAQWDLLPQAYAEIDDGRIVLVNLACSRLLGRPVDELEGESPYDLVHPDDVPVLGAATGLGEAQLLRTNVRLRRANSTYVRVLCSARLRAGRWHVTAVELDGAGAAEPGLPVGDGGRALGDAERLLAFGTFETDLRTGELRCSEHLVSMAGRLPQTASEAEVRLLPDERERVRGTIGKVLRELRPQRVEFKWMMRGVLATVEAWLFPRTEHGKAVGLCGIVRDSRPLELSEQRLERQSRLLDAVDVAVVGLDLDGRVINWNTAAERLYGWKEASVVGSSLEELVPEVGRARSEATVLESLRQWGFWEGDIELVRADGTRVPVLLREALVPGPQGIPAGRSSIALDLSVPAGIQEQLAAAREFLSTVTEKMADGVCTVDPDGRLTYMNEAAERLLGWNLAELRGRAMHAVTHHRHADGRPYPAEDCPITASRRETREISVSEDVFIRRDGLSLPVEYTCSPFTTDDGQPASVVVFRDITERAARDARMRVQFESLSWAGRVRDAIADDRLEVYGQAMIGADGAVVATELLVRMRDERGVLVTPREFWGAAESHGLLPSIDRFMIAAAGRIAAAGTSVAVNVATASITDAGFRGALELAVAAAGGVPLILELSERAVLSDEEAARAFLGYARGLGCRIAVDGFGTGPNGFAYLQRISADLLKIDLELIFDLSHDPASRPVVGAIVTLAEKLGLQTVAVGVETEETLALVRELGVELVQGRLASAPYPIEPARSQDAP